MRVMRLLLSMLCALGLAFAPVAASGAVQSLTSMPECTTAGGEMPDMPSDQSKMDCCTPACHAPAPATVLPVPDAGLADYPHGPKLSWAPVKELGSLRSSGLDPPPRA